MSETRQKKKRLSNDLIEVLGMTKILHTLKTLECLIQEMRFVKLDFLFLSPDFLFLLRLLACLRSSWFGFGQCRSSTKCFNQESCDSHANVSLSWHNINDRCHFSFFIFSFTTFKICFCHSTGFLSSLFKHQLGSIQFLQHLSNHCIILHHFGLFAIRILRFFSISFFQNRLG